MTMKKEDFTLTSTSPQEYIISQSGYHQEIIDAMPKDFKLVCDDGFVRIHRIVLMEASPFLGNVLFGMDPEETSSLTLAEVKVAQVEKVVMLIYHGRAIFNEEESQEICKIFKMLQFPVHQLLYRTATTKDLKISDRIKLEELDREGKHEDPPVKKESSDQLVNPTCSCPYCKVVFTHSTGFRRNLKLHLTNYHCEHYFPTSKLDSVSEAEFKQIFVDLLFLKYEDKTACSLCAKDFSGITSSFVRKNRLKRHMIQEHLRQMKIELMKIQKDPNLHQRLLNCNTKGRYCPCGMYFKNYRIYAMHKARNYCVEGKIPLPTKSNGRDSCLLAKTQKHLGAPKVKKNVKGLTASKLKFTTCKNCGKRVLMSRMSRHKCIGNIKSKYITCKTCNQAVYYCQRSRHKCLQKVPKVTKIPRSSKGTKPVRREQKKEITEELINSVKFRRTHSKCNGCGEYIHHRIYAKHKNLCCLQHQRRVVTEATTKNSNNESVLGTLSSRTRVAEAANKDCLKIEPCEPTE